MDSNPLSIIHVPPNKLRPNKWNSNRVSPENEQKIDNSIDELGFFKPIIVRVVDGELEILGGEHRWGSAIRRNDPSVPVINLGAIDDAKAKKISLIDNGRYGNDDTIELAKILDELGTPAELEAILPFNVAELEKIFSAVNSIDFEDLDTPDELRSQIDSAPPSAKIQTHATMKFRVRLEDQDRVTTRIKNIMKAQGFSGDTQEVNAGDALAWLIRDYEDLHSE